VPFVDRSDAGRQLAKALTAYKGQRPIVLALPRGGVPVAAEVAAMLDAPLDLILVRKIGAPYQPELAMGAVVDGGKPVTVRNEDVIRLSGVSEQEFNATRDEQLAEIERRRKLYLGDRPHPKLEGCVVIVVDDGIATGATMRAALQATRMRKPRKLVLAVPVAPTATLEKLRGDVDDLVCLEDYAQFGAIGYFYSDFRQVSDAEVIDILARHPLKPDAPSKEAKGPDKT
jgi:predicted phosphoribosyltransferase